MKALISVEFYKLRHIGLVWAAILIPVGMSMYLALNRNYIYDPEVVRYPWINYIGLTAMVGGVRVLAMVISFIVAYMAAMDLVWYFSHTDHLCDKCGRILEILLH